MHMTGKSAVELDHVAVFVSYSCRPNLLVRSVELVVHSLPHLGGINGDQNTDLRPVKYMSSPHLVSEMWMLKYVFFWKMFFFVLWIKPFFNPTKQEAMYQPKEFRQERGCWNGHGMARKRSASWEANARAAAACKVRLSRQSGMKWTVK